MEFSSAQVAPTDCEHGQLFLSKVFRPGFLPEMEAARLQRGRAPNTFLFKNDAFFGLFSVSVTRLGH